MSAPYDARSTPASSSAQRRFAGATCRDSVQLSLLRIVADRVRELRHRDAQIDAGIERRDAGAGQVGLGIDELDRGRALGVEQLLAAAVALLRRDQALLRGLQRVDGDLH